MWSEFMYMLQSDNCLYLLTRLEHTHSLAHTPYVLAGPKSVTQDGGDTTVNGTIQPHCINLITPPTIRVITDKRVA